MYMVETPSGGCLSKFVGLGKARDYARANKPAQIRNTKSGKLVRV